MKQKYLFYTAIFAVLHAVFFIAMLSFFRPIPGVDVAENFFWGQHFEFGYYKHPPLFAWIAEGFAKFFGPSVFTSYLNAQIFIALTFIFVFFLAREYLPEKQAFLCVLLLETLSFAGIAGRTFNANLVQIPFWILAPLFYLYGIKTQKAIHFALFGFFLGLSFLGKYFTALLGFVIFISFISNKKTRMLLKTPLPFISVAVFLVTISPHIFWLFENNFLPFEYIKSEQNSNLGFFQKRLKYGISFTFLSIISILPTIAGFFFLFKNIKFKGLNLQNPQNNLLFCITVLPFAILSVTSIITGMFILTKWSATLFFVLPVFLMYFFEKIDRADFKKRIIILLSTFFLFWGLIIAFLGFQDSKNKGLHFESMKQLAEIIPEKFKKETGQELQYIAGETLEVGMFFLFSKKRLTVIPFQNLKFTPYINKNDLSKKGHILLLKCGKFEDCKPEKYGKILQTQEMKFRKKEFNLFVILIAPT